MSRTTKFVKKWFWLGCGAVGVVTILIGILASGLLGFQLFQLEWKPQGQTRLSFQEVSLDFVNQTDIAAETGALPFMAGIVIDIDQDGQDEVILGGGQNQEDGVFSFSKQDSRFSNHTKLHALTKQMDDVSHGGVSVDINKDGFPELLISRESGIWLYSNTNGRLGNAALIFTPPPQDQTTILSITPGDLNQDGFVDLYLSGYIQNAHVKGQTVFTGDYGGYSYLLMGAAGGSFADRTELWGLRRQHNTFVALFADFEGDGDQDIIVAQDTGHIETWRNDGKPPLVQIPNPSVYSYPMGLAAGDFNGDKILDFYASNVGHTMPKLLLRGDLPNEAAFNSDYMLFAGRKSDGFSDIANEMNAGRMGFGWGVVAADFNLDGWEDIAVAQNYAKFGSPAIFHRYSGKILQNYDGKTFKPVEKRAGAVNRLFAISPLVGDYDGDGLPDLIWANLEGPAKAFLNRTPGANGLVIRLDDSVSAYGAIVTVTLDDRMLTRQVVPAQGLSSDQSASLFIGLGGEQAAQRVSIRYPDGEVLSWEQQDAGQVIDGRRDPSHGNKR